MNSHIEFDSRRIQHLIGSGTHDSTIMVVGLGSGGFPVLQHIAMSGWKKFILVDPDTLQSVNLVKHPALRSEGGRLKVNIAHDWLLDRNPESEITKIAQDIQDVDEQALNELASRADLIISATDNNSARLFINDLCINTETAMTVGLVHRGGTGGTVMAYRPGASGCYSCLECVAEDLDGLPTDLDFPQTPAELENVYERGLRGYAAAGLSADIAIVAAIHAQASIAELLALEDAQDSMMPPMSATWIAIDIRSSDSWNWRCTVFDLPQIDHCVSCGKVEAV